MDSDGNHSVEHRPGWVAHSLGVSGFSEPWSPEVQGAGGYLAAHGSTHWGISTGIPGYPKGIPSPKRNRRYQTSHPKYKHRGIFGYWGVFSIRVQSVLSIVKSNPCQNRSSPHLNPYNILPYCQQLLAFEAFPPLINQPAFLPGHPRRRPPTNWLLLFFLGWQPSMGPWFENCFLKRIN